MSRAPVLRARSATSRSKRCWWPPWSANPTTPRTGRGRRWPKRAGCGRRGWGGSGGGVVTAFGLKPRLVDTFKISTDPHFIDKVRDVVGLYLDPPEKALVLC